MSTISLFAATANKAASVGDTFYGIFYFLFMSAVILGAAYFVTKYLARRGLNPAVNKNLKVIETVPLGIDKSLLLVRVGEQYLLLGSSQKSITLLAEIEKEKLVKGSTNDLYDNIVEDSFDSYINKLRGGNKKEGLNSIKHNLDKLKSIVRGNKIDG